ncbi:MAG: histidine--tRNA ligase [Actinomycetota bacterium]
MKPTFNAPKGAPDLVPPRSLLFEQVISRTVAICKLAAYQRIETPAFEYTELFERGLDDASDIVTKEMYTFEDKGGRSLTLRPDMTAPVIRAILENRLDKSGLPVKLFYVASVFRHEKPQAGRQRQFTQVGIEAVGSASPSIDAEAMELAQRMIVAAGIGSSTLLLNSVGHPGCRAEYLPKLVAFLEAHREELCEDCQRKITKNPLRTFDCKVPSDRSLMEEAPLISDHLCVACKQHHEDVKKLLGDLGVGFTDAPRLVRGLDYYTRTAFEFVSEGLGAQNSIGGGGRYDGLSESLGGDPLPGIGFGLGIDRMVLALESKGVSVEPKIDVYFIALSPQARPVAMKLLSRIRSLGISADLDHMDRGAKPQFKAADRANARWAVILGDKELSESTVTLRNMSSGEEQSIPQHAIELHVGDE